MTNDKKIVVKFENEKFDNWLSPKQKNVIEYIKNLKTFPFFGVAGEKINLKTNDFLQERWEVFEKILNNTLEKNDKNHHLISQHGYHLKYWLVLSDRLDLLKKHKVALFNLENNQKNQDRQKRNKYKQSFGGSFSSYQLKIYNEPSQVIHGFEKSPKISLAMLSCIYSTPEMLKFILKYEKCLNTDEVVKVSAIDLILNPIAKHGVICSNSDMLFCSLQNEDIRFSEDFYQSKTIVKILEIAKPTEYKFDLLEKIIKKEYPHHSYQNDFYTLCDKIKLKDTLRNPSDNSSDYNDENKILKDNKILKL